MVVDLHAPGLDAGGARRRAAPRARLLLARGRGGARPGAGGRIRRWSCRARGWRARCRSWWRVCSTPRSGLVSRLGSSGRESFGVTRSGRCVGRNARFRRTGAGGIAVRLRVDGPERLLRLGPRQSAGNRRGPRGQLLHPTCRAQIVKYNPAGMVVQHLGCGNGPPVSTAGGRASPSTRAATSTRGQREPGAKCARSSLELGRRGIGPGQFQEPLGGRPRRGGQRVRRRPAQQPRPEALDPAGAFLGQWGTCGAGPDPGQFDIRRGIAVDHRARLRRRHCQRPIQKFDTRATSSPFRVAGTGTANWGASTESRWTPPGTLIVGARTTKRPLHRSHRRHIPRHLRDLGYPQPASCCHPADSRDRRDSTVAIHVVETSAALPEVRGGGRWVTVDVSPGTHPRQTSRSQAAVGWHPASRARRRSPTRAMRPSTVASPVPRRRVRVGRAASHRQVGA